MSPYLILLLGLLMIFLEFYLPGAIMGTIGAILIFVSMLLFIQQATSILSIALYILGIIAAVALVIKFALWKIPRSSFYSKDDQEGYVASSFDKNAIGKEAVVISDLKPGGYILVDGDQHQALSQSGYIEKGSRVIVLDGEGESLIVKLVNKEKKS